MQSVAQWEAFQTGSDAVGARPELLTSWRRSKWSGVDPLDVVIQYREHSQDSPFLQIAKPVLLRAAEALVGSSTSLALADRQGVVLWRWTSEGSLARDLDEVNMIAGSSFDESQVGTNGIGTALETGQPAVVVGAEHYVNSFHRWACAAAPVRHPVTGRVMGAVNVTCRVEDANHFFRLAAESMAQEVGSEVRRNLTNRERRLHDAYLRHQTRQQAAVVALDEKTFIADEIAGNFGLDHHRLWRVARGAGNGQRIDATSCITAQVFWVDPKDSKAGLILELSPRAGSIPEPTRPEILRAENPSLRHLSPLEQAEYAVVRSTMTSVRGNRSTAAALLEISRGTLYQKLIRYRLTEVR